MKFKGLDYNLKLEENSYYEIKTNGLRQHGVKALIKNKLPTENRIDFIKKMGHRKKLNVDFMRNP